jgi:signal transduction histidine kinase
MLYNTPDAALPRPEVVSHLGAVGRALAAALELGAVLSVVKSAERTLPQAVAANLAARGIEEVVESLVSLRDRLGALRQNPNAPSWFLEEFSHLAPSLSGALSLARSLLGFGRGQIQKDSLDAEEVVADLRSMGIEVRVAGDVRLSGDAALLRQALAALVDHLRDGDPSRARALQAHVGTEAGRVKIRIGVAGAGGERPQAYADLATPAASLRRADLRLAVAQKVVELHGGSLAPESDPAGHWAAILLPGG